MTVPLGTMQVPAPQDGDSVRRYETGTLPDGGLWTALTRLSNHDHTGGLNGSILTAAVIPDGSITTAKLDPSVLAPYSLTDGSKPFTGQVTMQADAIVRDTLYFGQQGSTGTADASIAWTSAQNLMITGALVDPTIRTKLQFGAAGTGAPDGTLTRSAIGVWDLTSTGTGSDAKAWLSFLAPGAVGRARIGQPQGTATTDQVWITANADYTGTTPAWNRDAVASPAAHLSLGVVSDTPTSLIWNLSTVRAGANPITWVPRMTVNNVGNTAHTADAGWAGVSATPFFGAGVQQTSNWGTTGSYAYRGLLFPNMGISSNTANANTLDIGLNTYVDSAGARRAMVGTIAGQLWQLSANQFTLYQMAQVATDATQTLVQRFVMDTNGNMNFSPPTAVQLNSGAALYIARPDNGASYGLKYDNASGALQVLWQAAATGLGFGANGQIFGGGNYAAAIGGASWQLSDSSPAGARLVVNGQRANYNGDMVYIRDATAGTAIYQGINPAGNGVIACAGSNITISASGTIVYGGGDNNQHLGYSGNRWIDVWAVTGTIQTCSAEAKTGAAPLDGAACAEAVLGTDWVSFAYVDPVKPEWYEPPAPDDEAPEARSARVAQYRALREAHDANFLKVVRETAHARQQNGYVLGHPTFKTHDLFGLSDRKSATPQSDLGVVACALQNALQRIAALEARP